MPQTEDKLVLYALERKIIKKNSASRKIGKQSYFFYKVLEFYCIFKGFEEKLRLPYSCKATLVFLQNYPHFSQSASVCRLCLQTESTLERAL